MAGLSEGRIEAVRQHPDERLGMRGARRGEHRLHRDIGPAVGDVVAHRVVEQDDLLGDEADLAAQRRQGHVAHVAAVDEQRPLGHVVETRQQVHQARLAGAARPDQRHDRAGGDDQIDPPQDGRLAVREMHPPELDALAERRQIDRARPLAHAVRQVHEVEDALGRGHRLLQLVVDLHQVLDRQVDHGERADEREELSARELAGADTHQGVGQEDGAADGPDQVQNRSGDGRQACAALLRALDPVERPAEAPDLEVLHPETLHDAGPGDPLLHHVDGFAHLLLAAPARALEADAEARHRVDDQGEQDQAEGGEPPVQVEQPRRLPDHDRHQPEDVREISRDRPLDTPDVVDDPRDQHAARVIGEERQRLSLDAGVQVGPQVPDHLEPDPPCQVRAEVGEDSLQHEQDDDQRGDDHDLARRLSEASDERKLRGDGAARTKEFQDPIDDLPLALRRGRLDRHAGEELVDDRPDQAEQTEQHDRDEGRGECGRSQARDVGPHVTQEAEQVFHQASSETGTIAAPRLSAAGSRGR